MLLDLPGAGEEGPLSPDGPGQHMQLMLKPSPGGPDPGVARKGSCHGPLSQSGWGSVERQGGSSGPEEAIASCPAWGAPTLFFEVVGG